MKSFKIYILLFITTLLYACQSDIEKQYNPDPQANFDALWKIIDERYCYFDAKNINWNDVYEIYNRKLNDVTDEFDLFNLFANMIDTLQDGHVNLYSSFDISRCNGWYENYPSNFNSSIVYNANYLTENYKIAGGLHYNTIANGSVGLIRYSSFSSSISSASLRYIDYFFSNCKGIIIDVRNNGGGTITNSERLAASFFKQPTLTGFTKHKTDKGHNDFSSPVEIITDPSNAFIDWSDKNIVILCNRRCYSATNDFIVRMLHAPNTTVIGGTTGGGGGLPLSQELPNGWLIRFSAAPMFDSKMNHTEFGVDPHVFVNLSPNDEQKNIDSLIEYAINLISKL